MFFRSVECNFNISEELLDLIPLTEQSQVGAYFKCIETVSLTWNKLVPLAKMEPSMYSVNVGVVGLLELRCDTDLKQKYLDAG